LPPERASVPPKRRWIAWLAGAAVLLAVVLVLANRDQAPEVQTAQVKRQNIAAYITSNGKVEPLHLFLFLAQFTTTVESVHAVAGESLKKGQLILVLNSDTPRQSLDAARASLLLAQEQLREASIGGPPQQLAQIDGDLQKTKISLANLQKNQEVLKKLVAEKAETQAQFDQNELQIAQAQASIQTLEEQKAALAAQARANVQSAKIAEQQERLQISTLQNEVINSRVTSPIDGTLFALPAYWGEYVTVGQQLAQVADLHNVRVRAFVDEPDLGALAEKQSVQITWDGLPGYVWYGRTETLPKQVTLQGVRSVGEVLCSVQNTNLKLIPNLSVDVKIETAQRQNVLVVPRGAVHSDGSQHYVFIIDDDTLRRRNVQLGIADPTVFEVVSGLNEGEQVALSGEITLHDGMTVHPVEANQ
jgi:HlyD family secretion protein